MTTEALALRVEADIRERAGEITHSQGLALIRAGRPSPLALSLLEQTERANALATALNNLYRMCLALDEADESKRPTEAEYQAAISAAAAALARR